MKTLKIIILALIIVFPVIFVVSNLTVLSHQEALKINLIFTSFESSPLPLGLMMLVSLAVGYAAAYILGYAERRRLKKNMKGLSLKQARIEEELHLLRNLPIVGESSQPVCEPNGTVPPEQTGEPTG